GLFLVGTFALASAQTISFDKTVYEYGNVAVGADGHRVFIIKNTGDKPLIISRTQASCGCTTPEVTKDPIMPGKTAELKVGYDTKIVGPFTKIIEVYSNDAENSRSVITIKGNVGDAAATIAPQTAIKTEARAMSAPQSMKVTPAAKKETIKKSEQL
ncbi:DUF1573 domain-containing protein, partial [Kaistella sp.]|uniref:DUF1573 domain-containing protein n=1 Tax=Kaistella sp. TaxID=2782235 RepID=UPI003C507282